MSPRLVLAIVPLHEKSACLFFKIKIVWEVSWSKSLAINLYLIVALWFDWYRDCGCFLELSWIRYPTHLLESSGLNLLRRLWYALKFLFLGGICQRMNFDYFIVVFLSGLFPKSRLRHRWWLFNLGVDCLPGSYQLILRLLFSFKRFDCGLSISLDNSDGLFERFNYESRKAFNKFIALRPTVHLPTRMMLANWPFDIVIIFNNLYSLQRLEHIYYCGRILGGWG